MRIDYQLSDSSSDEEFWDLANSSSDKELLNFIYRYKEQIKYVIFVSNQGIEIICLDKIPYLLKLMPWDYVILPMVVGTVSTLYNISIPIKQETEEKKDE